MAACAASSALPAAATARPAAAGRRTSAAAALQQQPSPPAEQQQQRQLYWAFGANMAPSVLARRGVKPRNSEPAVLADRGSWLSFQHRGGYATLLQQPPGVGPAWQQLVWQQPHGVLYELSATDLQKLVAREGGYRLAAVDVRTYGGRRASAAAFLSSPLLRLWQPVPPVERYRALLLEGCEAHGLDAEYTAWLRALDVVDSRAAAARDAKYDACPAQALAQLLAAGAAAGAAWAAIRV